MTHTTTSPTIRIDKPGGPEEMKLVDLPVGDPGPGEVRIRQHASGLNYIDVYQRSGVYTLPMPLTMGNEGAGVIFHRDGDTVYIDVEDSPRRQSNNG